MKKIILNVFLGLFLVVTLAACNFTNNANTTTKVTTSLNTEDNAILTNNTDSNPVRDTENSSNTTTVRSTTTTTMPTTNTTSSTTLSTTSSAVTTASTIATTAFNMWFQQSSTGSKVANVIFADVTISEGASFNVMDNIDVIDNNAVNRDSLVVFSSSTCTISNTGSLTTNVAKTCVVNYTASHQGVSLENSRNIIIEAPAGTGYLSSSAGDPNNTNSGWKTYLGEGGAAEFTTETIGGDLYVKTAISSISSTSYGIRLSSGKDSNNFMTLEDDKLYRASFWAKADAAKTIKVQLGQLLDIAPYYYPAIQPEFYTFDITSALTEYSFEFQLSGYDGNIDLSKLSLLFEMGTVNASSTVTNVWIGKVAVTDCLDPVISANNINLDIDDAFVLSDIASIYDVTDGDVLLTDADVNITITKNEVIVDEVLTSEEGVYEIQISYTNSLGLYAEKTITVSVIDHSDLTIEGYNLLWNDEFNGTSLDTTKWVCEIGNNSGWGNNEWEYYTDRENNVSVSDGNLTITALAEEYGGCSYTSARLKTQSKFSFKYGYVCARIKLPSLQGIWPAFWMLGDSISEEGWAACGEIDIMEAINNEVNTTYSTLHWTGTANTHVEYGNGGVYVDDRTEFHLYEMYWDADYVVMCVDGVETFRMSIADGVNGTSEFHENFFLLLNVAVCGNWPGFSLDTASLPASMVVDYVRVYQLS